MQPSMFFATLLFIMFFPFLSFGVTLSKTGSIQTAQIVGADRLAVSDGFGFLTSTATDAFGQYDYLTIVNLTSMSVVSNIADGKFQNTPAIAVSGDYVYVVSTHHRHLVIVDVSNKASPTVVGTPFVNENFAGAHSIAVLGNHVYVSRNDANNPMVVVISVETKNSPSVAATITLDSSAPPTALAAANDKLFIGTGSTSNKLAVYNVADPTSAQSLANLQGPSGCSYRKPSSLVISGTDLYMAANYHSLIAVSFSGAPTHTSCLEDDNMQEIQLGHVHGSYLYTVALDSNDAYRLLPIDNTDTAAMTLASSEAIALTGVPLAVSGDGDKIYVLKEQHTIDEISILPEGNQKTTTTIDPSSDANNVNNTTTSTEPVSKTEDIQGNPTWWFLIFLTTCCMCVVIPCCAYLNVNYVRPARISRLERKREAAKIRKMQTLEAAGAGMVLEDDSDGYENKNYE